jgi:hypothetical protein
MVDPKKAAELILQHFEELTTEQFVENLRSLSHEKVSGSERREPAEQKKTQNLLKSENLPVEK